MRNNHSKNLGRVATILAACLLLSGCACCLKDAPITGVRYYKSLGSVQCADGGQSIDELEQVLLTAGITVTEKTCGSDGKMRAAVCGAPDGRIGIFKIEGKQAKDAAALGFEPLGTLTGATVVPCDVR